LEIDASALYLLADKNLCRRDRTVGQKVMAYAFSRAGALLIAAV
jgi:hypothetical protein